MSVLIVGSVAYDGIEAPAGKVDRILGGSATYASVASSFFTSPVRLVGTAGNDFDEQDLQFLTDHNIDLDGFRIDQSGKTFFWKGRYHSDFNSRDTLDTQLNVFEHFDPVIPDSWKDSSILCLGNIEPSLQRNVLDQVRKPRLTLLDTMNFWISGAREALEDAISRVDIAIINDQEAKELTGKSQLADCAREIRKMGPSYLIIKKGEHGAQLYSDELLFTAPAFPVPGIVDPTGAGDTFMGAFAGWLDQADTLDENTLREAVAYGSALAAFCVEKFGPGRFAGLDRSEIDSRYDALRGLSRIPGRS
ncbi:PfkB family carbohydrate kinase [Natronogracilivirga saccharolytica]|uniref:Carbohydrate kinase PfkB domain-containing protein n=1 Tax=Natronogracilivirga saccharolytica TaxID=2812953 RepID=A0A8J7S9L4_9BACT|nr:PfkB family carbohydrate kinase [Natronogracilivirga saccharolytica]MBP3192626.1 hypothetical protein [Natronogracilivirga saccharolytica]